MKRLENIDTLNCIQLYETSNNVIKSPYYESIPRNIRENIEATLTKSELIKMEIRGIPIRILFMFNEAEDASPVIQFKEQITDMYKWLYLVLNNAPQKKHNAIEIFIYFSSLKKTVGGEHQVLNWENINTGMTQACMKSSKILIFRKEEWFKCFLHETFHSLCLDFSALDITPVVNKVKQFFPVIEGRKIQFAEVYCETWATLLNIAFRTKHLEMDDYDKMEFFAKCLQYEQTFSLFQCAKILHKMKLNSSVELTDKRFANAWKEKTNVFCYFILKSVLLVNSNDFLNWILDNNSFENPFFIAKNIQMITRFWDLIAYEWENSLFTGYLDNMMVLYKKIDVNNEEEVLKSLKMTLFG